MKTVAQYKRLNDIPIEDQLIVEMASEKPLEQLDIDDVNSFLNGLYLFHEEAEEDFWKNLS